MAGKKTGSKNNKKTGKKINKTINKKNLPLIIALSAAAVVVIAVLCIIIGRENAKNNTVEYGVPVDYEAAGYIKLGEYKNIPADVSVSDKDVEDEIQYALEDSESYEKLTGTAKDGDMVNIDYECVIDGEPLEDYSSENEYTTLGDEDFFTEFDEQIPGMNTGETKDIEVNVPEDYGDELIDGKTAQFKVTLNYICGEEEEPQLTDEFVSEYSEGECTSVADFNEYIRKSLYDDNVENLTDNIWESVLENVKVKKYHKGELKIALKETQDNYANFADASDYSVDELLESFGMTRDDMEEMGKETAVEKMAAKTIAVKENITLSEEEYRNLLIEFMEYEDGEEQGKTLEEIEADYEEMNSENPKDAMLRENVKKKVREWANVTGLE